MTWETPMIEDIACGMEVTAYAPATEAITAVSAANDQAPVSHD